VNAARNVHNHGGVSSGISAELACTKVMKHKSFVDLTSRSDNCIDLRQTYGVSVCCLVNEPVASMSAKPLHQSRRCI